MVSIAIAILVTSCVGVYICTEGSGHLSKETFTVQNFQKLSINVPSKIFIIQDSIPKLEIETDDNLFNFLNIEVSNEKLTIDSEKGICPRKLHIYITNPVFKEIEVNGSGDIFAQSPINTDEINIGINGSGDVSIDSIKAQKIKIEINGSGDIKVAGSADNFLVEINGSGDVKALKLLTRNATIETNGSGDVYVNTTEELSVDISGSGDVYYLGNPRSTHLSISGSGTIKKYFPKGADEMKK